MHFAQPRVQKLEFLQQMYGSLCTVHTYTNFDTIEYDFVYLENLTNIFIIFVMNRTYAPFTHTRISIRLNTILYI